jgi:hypothetical protein
MTEPVAAEDGWSSDAGVTAGETGSVEGAGVAGVTSGVGGVDEGLIGSWFIDILMVI